MADFQNHLLKLGGIDVKILAASVDDLETAARTVHNDALAYPVGYGLDFRQIAELTGCFFDPDKGYLHAAGFILDPRGLVKLAVYSTGPIGRLVADDCLRLIGHYMQQSVPD